MLGVERRGRMGRVGLERDGVGRIGEERGVEKEGDG
jgi:hypothetical protein